jgi:hypothetical protein
MKATRRTRFQAATGLGLKRGSIERESVCESVGGDVGNGWYEFDIVYKKYERRKRVDVGNNMAMLSDSE